MENFKVKNQVIKNFKDTYLYTSLKRLLYFSLLTFFNLALCISFIPFKGESNISLFQNLFFCVPLIIILIYFFFKILSPFFKERGTFNLVDAFIFNILLFDLILLFFNMYMCVITFIYA